ncbi:nuclear transport factor 2 family protein [Brevundimonas sp.]|uniref:nuclear transport factor 2 family protein n=1 Tax=Brevundimonas sp. TaxID=1871086 RepID=UPI0026102B58|nr:nuclear transport factor 2 family protein [Brevundimonas sp.]
MALVSGSLLFGGITSLPARAVAQEEGGFGTGPFLASSPVEQIARDIERAQSLRRVKDLQYTFAQYGEYGLWADMASLFASNAEYIDGDTTIRGQEAIRGHFLRQFGGGRNGLVVGQLRNQMFYAPVVTLSVDGGSATGRWTELTMTGTMNGRADWSGGMQVNDYVKEDGVWKISRMRVIPQFAGPYETGWFTPTANTPLVPYHYTPGLAGRPVPIESGDADRTPRNIPLADLEQTVAAMNAEDQVRNLQNIYGYYQDRKMWDDVTDLFTSDGVLEIAGVGVYDGVAGIRRALERDGPAGLQRGQINDQIQLHTVITIDPNGVEAQGRGLQLGMLTPELGVGQWQVSTFVNRYVLQDGKWRIREMRIYPKMKADYYEGWHRSSIVDPVPTGAAAPDRASPASNSPQLSPVIPAFFTNPVTRQAPSYPTGFRIVGDDRLVPGPVVPAVVETARTEDQRVAEARRRLDVSKAYDAVENISSTFGYYLDDWKWDEFVQNMAVDGTRPQGAGFYVGREHLYRAMLESHLAPWSESNPLDGIRLHLRIQPVIDVTPDARSAKIRTRMFLYFANSTRAGAWNSGMYPNDTAVLEEGVWKMRVGGVIDETYFNSSSYAEGWARSRPRGAVTPGAPRQASRNGNPISFAPDIPWSLYADYRRRNFSTTNYPDIKPMWFAYRNPISGRTPEYYCPDILTCFGP